MALVELSVWSPPNFACVDLLASASLEIAKAESPIRV